MKSTVSSTQSSAKSPAALDSQRKNRKTSSRHSRQERRGYFEANVIRKRHEKRSSHPVHYESQEEVLKEESKKEVCLQGSEFKIHEGT